MTELKRCPCGEIPDRLVIKYVNPHYICVYGSCCELWAIQFLGPCIYHIELDGIVRSMNLEELKNQRNLAAEKAWNAAPRDGNDQKILQETDKVAKLLEELSSAKSLYAMVLTSNEFYQTQLFRAFKCNKAQSKGMQRMARKTKKLLDKIAEYKRYVTGLKNAAIIDRTAGLARSAVLEQRLQAMTIDEKVEE